MSENGGTGTDPAAIPSQTLAWVTLRLSVEENPAKVDKFQRFLAISIPYFLLLVVLLIESLVKLPAQRSLI